jgi:PIN domain nuclease of toxin-antitoxin system
VRLLLDTHVLLWWFLNDPRLSQRASALLSDPEHEVVVSAASAWEITTKYRNGKLPHAAPIVPDLPMHILRQGFAMMEITLAHAHRAGLLAGLHRAPFDRMLAAQGLNENMPIVSSDVALDGFGVSRLW